MEIVTIKQHNEDIKSYMGVLREEHMHALKGISEKFLDSDRNFKEIRETLASHSEVLGELKVDVEVLKEDVSILKEDVSVLKKDVSELKSDMKEVKSDLGVMNIRVSHLETAVI